MQGTDIFIDEIRLYVGAPEDRSKRRLALMLREIFHMESDRGRLPADTELLVEAAAADPIGGFALSISGDYVLSAFLPVPATNTGVFVTLMRSHISL